jgi:Na+/pantothenate symporter
LPKFWVLALAQIVLVVGAAFVWFYFRTTAYLAGPPDPDNYAWNWGFQLIVFAVFWLPAILLFIGILLAIERTALISYYRARELQSDQHRL